MALKTQTCANHPERPGRANCMKCKKTVCLECATLWDGINYCVHCLKTTREGTREKSSFVAWTAMLLSIVALFYLGSYVMVWAASLMTRMF